MRRNQNRDRLRPIIFIGYFVLFALTIAGIYRIYKDLVSYSELDNKGIEKNELRLLSSTLVEIVNAERIREALYFNNYNAQELVKSYEESGTQIEFYIDSLRRTSDDEKLRAGLDTVSDLFLKKKENLIDMIWLIDTINKLPQSHFVTTTILSQKELSDLSAIITEELKVEEDTTYVMQKRRSLGERIRSVFVDKGDSTQVITSSRESVSYDTIKLEPAVVLTDTLKHFINEVNRSSSLKKAAYLIQLTRRQNEMIYFDESMTAQISNVLNRIEENEEKLIEEKRAEKEGLLKSSAKSASKIALTALAVLLLFLLITYLLLRANQRYRQNLEEVNLHIRGLLKSRDKLLLMISHDVKAPLSSIIGHTELLSRGDMPQLEKVHLESIRSSSEQILELSNKLIDHHRFEKEDPSLNIVSFEAYKLMNDVFNAFEPVAKKKNLKLISEIAIDADRHYDSDPFVIRQIINNLVDNAIKFTKEGSVTINSSYNHENGNLRVSVKDTGPGIEKSEQSKIFLPFERVGTTTDKLEIEGSGLGLQIVQKLVDLLGGTIYLNSEYGAGAEFILEIPLPASGSERKKSGESSDLRERRVLNASVLMVDDETTILSVYSRMLEQSGARVTICSDATRVSTKLEEKEFDIIFTDIQMPGINGFELVKKIRDRGGYWADVPIVALSGRSDLSEEEFKAAGFTAFLPKPVPFELMEDIIARVTEGVKADRLIDERYAGAENAGLKALVEYVQDDKELSLEILNTFLEDSRQKLSQLKEAKKRGDGEQIQSVAHKLLPLMNMIGRKEMLSTLEQLEQGATDIKQVKSTIANLENVIKETESFILTFSKK